MYVYDPGLTDENLSYASSAIAYIQKNARDYPGAVVEVRQEWLDALEPALRLEITDLLDVMHGAGTARRYPSGVYNVYAN